MFLITSLTVTRSRIVRTKYVSSIPITSLPTYFACPLGDDQLAYGVKEGTTAYRLEYAHVLNYIIDIEFCQFIHNSPLANVKTILDNNKKVMYNNHRNDIIVLHLGSQKKPKDCYSFGFCADCLIFSYYSCPATCKYNLLIYLLQQK